VLAALYVLWLYQRTMTGPLKPAVARFPELTKREAGVLVPAIAVLLVLGFYPKPVLDVATPAVDATMTTIDRSDPPPTIPVQAGNAEEGTTP
jgi:NADH-quinone oxidoreductase subunit M